MITKCPAGVSFQMLEDVRVSCIPSVPRKPMLTWLSLPHGSMGYLSTLAHVPLARLSASSLLLAMPIVLTSIQLFLLFILTYRAPDAVACVLFQFPRFSIQRGTLQVEFFLLRWIFF